MQEGPWQHLRLTGMVDVLGLCSSHVLLSMIESSLHAEAQACSADAYHQQSHLQALLYLIRKQDFCHCCDVHC